MDNCGKKWGIFMLMGEFHHSIDSKSRMIIPAKFREVLGNSFIVTRGIENCIYIYPKEAFETITLKLNSLPFTKKNARSFVRFFLSGALEVELDKQGRILVPEPLAKYSSLSKNCVIIGAGERLEVWDEENWNEFFRNEQENMSSIAEDLFAESEERW